jgi:ferritin-like protein
LATGTDVNDKLGDAFAAEQAAIYAYGPIGVHLVGDREAAEARTAELTHRARRDALITRLEELAATMPPTPPGYALPFPVTDRAGALKLAIEVEDRVAATWRSALPVTEGEDRRMALDALTDCAVRATRWRRLAGVTPRTVPFPGRV